MAKVPHIVTIDGKKYSALLPDIYGDIKTVVNVEKAPDNDTTNYAGKCKISEFVLNGDIVRIKCRLENKKYKVVVCASEKFASAMAGLLPRKVAGVNVKSTSVPRRMRLG